MRAAATLLLLLLVPAGALADDVHLTNGGVFEDVLAEWQGDSLRVRMPGGELRLARSSVERVVETTGGQAEYLRRAEALRAGRAGAAAWLDLARWARAEGLGRAAREAALEAGERDPRLAGLAPLLEGYGLVLHGEAGRWITHEESMRRQGFVRYDGRWITRREHAELERAAAEEAAVARAEIERRRVERAAAEARLAAAQLELERERLVTAQTLAPPVYYAPVYYPPFVVVPGPNVFGYFFTFTVVGHFLAFRGARRAVSEVRWSVERDAALTAIGHAVSASAPDRYRRIHEAAAPLRLAHLARFVERMAPPPA